MKHEGVDNKWDYNRGVVTGDTCQHEVGTYLHLPARPAQLRTVGGRLRRDNISGMCVSTVFKKKKKN